MFGSPKSFKPAPVPAEHYIYFRGGVLDLGRLSMRGVDLEMLNKDGDKLFDFSMRDVFTQAMGGYLKNTPAHGLVAYVATFRDNESALK